MAEGLGVSGVENSIYNVLVHKESMVLGENDYWFNISRTLTGREKMQTMRP